ncbi:MAG TPA: trypsin-like serine protease [Bdellovibrionota bacterium]|jgi:secreted trypsin-like serine protease
MRQLFLLLLPFLFLEARADEGEWGLPAIHDAVVRGDLVGADKPLARMTVSLNTVSRDGIGFCSGTILSPWLIVTAAHCLTFQNGTSAKLIAVRSTLENKVHLAAGWATHPDFLLKTVPAASGTTVDEVSAHDIALVKLLEPLEFPELATAALPEADLFAGQERKVMIAGYGQTGPDGDSNPAQKLYSGESLAKIEDSPLGGDRQVVAHGEGAQICHGDSGGPVILNASPESYLVGVHSTGDCGSFSKATSVFHNLSWIRRSAAALGAEL